MSNKSKDRKRFRNLKSDNAVSIEFFVKDVLGINNTELLRMGLTHKELKQIIDTMGMGVNVRRTSYDDILTNPEKVMEGNTFIVVDSANKTIPYMVDREFYLARVNSSQRYDETPYEEISYVDEADTTKWDHKPEVTPISDYDLKSMSTYELEQVLRNYKKQGQRAWAQVVTRELTSRRDSKSSSKASKSKAKQKEYKREKNIRYN